MVVRNNRDDRIGYRFLLGSIGDVAICSEDYPEKQLGTAYALIFWVQNIGLSMVPLLIGWILDTYCKIDNGTGKPAYDYTIPMAVFTCFGVLALFIALMLKREDRIKGYGLELPNIQKGRR